MIPITSYSLLSGLFVSSVTPVPLDSGQIDGIGLNDRSHSHWHALPPDSGRPEAILLRDGTEETRLDSARWSALPKGEPGRWTLPPVPDLAMLREWTKPPQGLQLEWTFRRSRSDHSSPLDRNVLSASVDQPWSDWFSLGLLGGVERTYSTFILDSISNDPDRAWWPWFGGRACVRSACWEFRTSEHPIPEALWTKESMDALAERRDSTGEHSPWPPPPPRSGFNWQNSWTARVGAVAWRTTVDRDRFPGAAHELSIRAFEGDLFRWTALVGTDDTRAWTGFAVGVAPREFALPWNVPLESSPATLVFRYSNVFNLSLELRTSLRLLQPWSFP